MCPAPDAQRLGCRQAVRHQTLTLAFVGSNPAIPANDPLAQSVEQLPFKQWVWSSSLQRVTKKADTSYEVSAFLFVERWRLEEINPTVRWTVGRPRLDGDETLIFLCFAKKNANESPTGHRNEVAPLAKQKECMQIGGKGSTERNIYFHSPILGE